MTTDNRTNGPTEAQIEHVRDQLEAKWPEMVCYWHPHRGDDDRQHEWEAVETWDIAEAALRAADAVVTGEQVEWQYGLQDSDGFVSFRNLSLRSLRKRAKRTGEVIVRRRPASKWLPVEGENNE